MEQWKATEQLGDALSSLGSTMFNTAIKVNEIEAQNQADAFDLAVAQQMEDFKKGLLSDPDHGTPGQSDGYMAKWNDKADELRGQIQGLSNPTARKMASQSLEKMLTSQGSAVYQLQFDAWGKDTVAQRYNMIKQRYDSSGLPVQEQIDLASSDLDFLYSNNLISAADRDSQRDAWGQAIIEKDLVDRGKAAYKASGSAAAQRVLADDQQVYRLGGTIVKAGEKAKASAAQSLAAFQGLIDDQADEAMEAQWASTVSYLRGGKAPSEPLTVSGIQGWKTQDGYGMSAGRKEYWIARLEALSNGQATGAGTKAAAAAKLYLNRLDQAIGALKQVKGGVLAGDAAVSIVDDSGKVVTSIASRDDIVALQKQPWFVEALNASDDGWSKYFSALASLDKPAGAWDALRQEVSKKLEKNPLKAQLLAEFDQTMNGVGQNWTPDKARAFVDKGILGQAYKVKVDKLFDDKFSGNRYNGSEDNFARDAFDGYFADYVTIDSQNRGKITNPLVAPNYNNAMSQVWDGLNRLGYKTTPVVYGDGSPWFLGDPTELKDPEALRGLTTDEKRAGRKPESVSFTIAPVTSNRDARYIRDIYFPNGKHVLQAYEVLDGKGSWVDVYLQNKGAGGFYNYLDPAAFQAAKKESDTRKNNAQADYFSEKSLH